MDTKILSGKDVSITTYQALQSRIKALKSQSVVPGLAVLLVGEDAGSQIYVRNKTKKICGPEPSFKYIPIFIQYFPRGSAIENQRIE